MIKVRAIDKRFFLIIAILVAAGYLIFSSASLGRLAHDQSIYTNLAFKQAIVGILGGGIALLVFANIPFQVLKKTSLYFLIIAIILNLLVFVPHLAIQQNGAARWIGIGSFSFQPSEVLKFFVVIYYATWLSMNSKVVDTLKYGLGSLLLITGVTEAILLSQRDTDIAIVAALIAMFFVAGGKLKHILLFFGIGILCLGAIVWYRPYIQQRIFTFIDPSRDSLGSSYQLQQGLIAVGTGGFFGRGFGQSIQKFNFLPEAIGDSIFAVEAEEFGFIGSIVLIALFLMLALRGMKIASDVKDPFGSTLIVAFIVLMVGQSFMNIGAIVGLLPLTGVPLLFVSQGGTAMLIGLAEAGIILNISKFKK